MLIYINIYQYISKKAIYIKERIEVPCSKSKLSAKEITYLFTNNQNSLRRNWMLRQPLLYLVVA